MCADSPLIRQFENLQIIFSILEDSLYYLPKVNEKHNAIEALNVCKKWTEKSFEGKGSAMDQLKMTQIKRLAEKI